MISFGSDVNFIPEDIVESRKYEQQKSSGTRFGIVMVILAAVIGGGLFIYNQRQTTRLNNLRTQISSENIEIQNLKDFGEQGYKLGVRLAEVQNIITSRNKYSLFLTEVDVLKPAAVQLTKLDVSGSGIELSGISATDYTPVAEYKENLLTKNAAGGEESKFLDVFVANAKLSTDEKAKGIEFTLGLKLMEGALTFREAKR